MVSEKSSQLKTRQQYPLDLKIAMSKLRIREWNKHYHGKVYVAFSGGKDSTVLLHLAREELGHVQAVFSNTGLEYPEILQFVRTIPFVTWIRPEMKFREIINKYGYPVVSKEVSQKILEARTTKSVKLLNKRLHGDGSVYKSGKIPNKWQYLIHQPFQISHKCCDVLKKKPFKKYEKESGLKPILGTMASDSHTRKQKYIRYGCNNFVGKRQESMPLAFWTENDIWEYIQKYNLSYSSIYDMGYERTGCTTCMFGVHLEKSDLFHKNRFQRMKQTHPKMWNYCINKLGIGNILDIINVNYGR